MAPRGPSQGPHCASRSGPGLPRCLGLWALPPRSAHLPAAPVLRPVLPHLRRLLLAGACCGQGRKPEFTSEGPGLRGSEEGEWAFLSLLGAEGGAVCRGPGGLGHRLRDCGRRRAREGDVPAGRGPRPSFGLAVSTGSGVRLPRSSFWLLLSSRDRRNDEAAGKQDPGGFGKWIVQPGKGKAEGWLRERLQGRSGLKRVPDR